MKKLMIAAAIVCAAAGVFGCDFVADKGDARIASGLHTDSSAGEFGISEVEGGG